MELQSYRHALLHKIAQIVQAQAYNSLLQSFPKLDRFQSYNSLLQSLPKWDRFKGTQLSFTEFAKNCMVLTYFQ